MAGSPAPPAKGRKLTLKSPTTWLIVTGVALVFGGYLLWKRSQSSSASSPGGSSAGTPTDYSGALGTLQSEIGNLQSSGASGGGTSVVPVGSASGGGGTVTTTDTGPSTGGNSSGASGGYGSSGSSSNGGGGSTSSSGGGTSTATATAPSVTNGRVVSVSNNRAIVAWDGPGASQWAVTRTGPGGTVTNVVNTPEAVYGGLASGHNYEIRIQPLVNGKPAGTGGGIDFKTT